MTFNSKSYCTSHNELCDDLSFACDKNCQVYKDYKQLKRFDQVLWGTVKDYKKALEEILESAKFAQCVPCGDMSNCDNCDDEITNNGQFCMHKRIEEIKAKINEVLND